MIPIDMLVVTSADFALLRNGRPVASGMWDDVLTAQVKHEQTLGPDTVRLVLRLRDGAEFIASDDAPGWDDFVDAAESALPGIVRSRHWPVDGGEGAVEVFRRA